MLLLFPVAVVSDIICCVRSTASKEMEKENEDTEKEDIEEEDTEEEREELGEEEMDKLCVFNIVNVSLLLFHSRVV